MAVAYPKGERNAVYTEEEHAASYFLLFGAALRAFPDREERVAHGSMLGEFLFHCQADPTRETDSILRSTNLPVALEGG